MKFRVCVGVPSQLQTEGQVLYLGLRLHGSGLRAHVKIRWSLKCHLRANMHSLGNLSPSHARA